MLRFRKVRAAACSEYISAFARGGPPMRPLDSRISVRASVISVSAINLALWVLIVKIAESIFS